jgi:hypothetical protein
MKLSKDCGQKVAMLSHTCTLVPGHSSLARSCKTRRAQFPGRSRIIPVLTVNLQSQIFIIIFVLENKQRLIERFLYGDLPTTLRGQKILSLIGNEAVSLSKDISENIYFRKDEFTTELPIRVSCCTWNVNGGTRSPNLNTDLGENKFADWLLGKADRRRAAYDFTGEAETDLSFVAGDIITVTGTSSETSNYSKTKI